jgi:myo-inositol-1(or 4)-monophosphatase
MTARNDFPTLGEVEALAREAGAAAMRYFRHNDRLEMHNKLNDSDIVTTADKESEELITGYIRTHYPAHAILSEESGETAGTSGCRWVIDPVDGTTNFFSGLPAWAISIGVEREGRTELGVVFLPALGEMFSAERGKGAWLNGAPIRVSGQTALSRSVIATGFPVDKDTNPDNNLDNLAAILPLVRDIRRLGSAATELCYTAAGFFGGYWELNLHEWDVNAGTLILEEAGGICTRFRHDRGVSVVCGAPAIHDRLLPLLSRTPRVRP